MILPCGHSKYHVAVNSEGFATGLSDLNTYIELPKLTSHTQKLYTAFLGAVDVEVTSIGNTVQMEKIHRVNGKEILVKNY